MIFVFLNVPTQKGSLKRSSCLNKLHTQKTADGTAALPAVFHIYAYLPEKRDAQFNISYMQRQSKPCRLNRIQTAWEATWK